MIHPPPACSLPSGPAAGHGAPAADRASAARSRTPDAAHFAAAHCHNCGSARSAPFCGQCGQEKARRFGLRTVGSEAWQNWRWFEWDVLRSAWRLMTRPGTVAREYVLGARKKHMHPLKLLLIAIGVMLLVVARSNYLDTSTTELNQATATALIKANELVRAWSNWSFSLSFVAILAASLLVFRRRGGYNATEHLVLAVYCQFLVICASTLSKLPTLFWRTPEFLATHKIASAWFTNTVAVLILALAFSQFLQLQLRRDGERLLLALTVFVAIRWALLKLYGLALAKVVLSQMA